MQWTKQQQDAIDTRGCDLLVAAAAGSGKTAVLVERIIKIITNTKNPVDIDKLLVVTFTNAAAAEMRERLGETISKRLEEEPNNTHLQKQLTLLNRASISTIHSFCLEVIKSNFHILDLDPSFRIADEAEIILLKTDIMEELFEDLYEKGDEGFYSLVESYGGQKEDTRLQEMILNIHRFIQSNPWPNVWVRESIELFNPTRANDFNATVWAEIIKEQIKLTAEGLLEISKQAHEICLEPDGPEKYIDAIKDDINVLERLISLCREDIDILYTYISRISFSSLGRCSKDTDISLKEEASNLRNLVKDGIREDIQDKIFSKSPKEMLEDIHRVYPVMKILGEVIEEFANRFQDVKREKAIIDFNDIEHYCLKILLDEKSNAREVIPSLVAFELQKKYEEILIDEYQDSNLVQETILEVISRKNNPNFKSNRFMVGDVKQSIYRFRLAKPDLFIDKYNSFSIEEKKKEFRIDLFQNFRSRENILYGVNFLFRQIMTPNLGEIEYDEKASLNPGAKYPDGGNLELGGPIELHMIEIDGIQEEFEKNEGIQEELEDISRIELEARVIAQRIKKLTDENEPLWVYDKKAGTYRKVDYKDIVILLRTTSNWSNVFMEELTKEGIPAYADASTGYFNTIEIKTVLSLLQIIDNPRQDIPLITVLRSPIVSLSCDELVEIKTSFPQGDYYESMKKYIAGSMDSTELSNKLNQFLNNLKKWRREAAHIPINELLWMLYTQTNYYNYLGAMPGGMQRQANLRILRDRAAGYETTSFKGLFNFIRFIEKIQMNKSDMGAAKIVGENENIVRIMSIHKSKGLEFPVVFVSGLGKQFNLKDLSESILLHQDLGLGPDYIDHERRISFNTAAKIAIRRRMMVETLSEEMRILYVALTRAKEKLILTGTVKNIENNARRWLRIVNNEDEKISPYILTQSKTFLDWIGLGLVRHRDGKPIRDLGNCLKPPTEVLYEDTSKWNIFSWSKSDISLREEGKVKEKENILGELLNWDTQKIYSSSKEEIYNKLSWSYSHGEAAAIPVKVSISEIKRHYEQSITDEESTPFLGEVSLKRPRFIEEAKGFTSAEKGTIIHFVMKNLDIKSINDTKDIENQLLSMETRGLLTREEKNTIFIPSLLRFYKSELARRITDSSKVKKEVPFILSINANEIYKDLISEEEIFIQGIIDCYFEEEDGIVLVDYKTDFIQDKINPQIEIEKIMKKYEIQMNLYKRAIEEITGKEVKERCLYLFNISKAVYY
ncbi:MAG: helicase-exonuclease AddAB subunit AddA [Epulopiscium sp.]|nr:helicase-exonuclease AddAB subunit AddA [Candidatus Epulonipiscium sp.]